MSRLSKKPIAIPKDVTVTIASDGVVAKGPKGEQKVPLLPFTKVEMTEGGVMVTVVGTHAQARANVGTMWSLTNNAIEGVMNGFVKVLEIEGVGYKAAVEGKNVMLSLGYVNPVKFPIPDGLNVVMEKNTMTITGINKELVGRIASEIRSLKKPEPYKGKGIHYKGEVIVRKVGKKAATASA
jgi:large subunit ribosomal protein L6